VGGGSGARNAFLNWSMIIFFGWMFFPFVRGFLPGNMQNLPSWSPLPAVPVVAATSTPISFGSINVEVQVNYPTPYPGQIPGQIAVPTTTPIPNLDYLPIYTVGYSYYNPDLGGVNCHVDNWDGVKCADTTASGISWRDYVGRAVAVPPSWVCQGLGYGSIVEVLSPDSIRGEYLVVDLCAGCEAYNWEDRTWRIDFLDTGQRLTWAYPVDLRFVSVVPPIKAVTDVICGD